MSDNITNPTKPACNMSEPYAVQMRPLASALTTFLRGNKATFTTYHTLGTSEMPWPTHSDTAVTYSRAEALEAGNRFVIGAVTSGAKYASDLPTKGTKAGVIKSLAMTYTIKKGRNVNNKVCLVLHALAAMRGNHMRAIRRAKTDAAIVVAEGAGGAFFAAGVTDKDSNPRPYPNEASACKAWARDADNYGATWWQGDNKAAILAEAATHVTRGLPTSVTLIEDMHHLKVINLAKQANAPSDITTGTGAANRCRTWFLDNPMSLTTVLNE